MTATGQMTSLQVETSIVWMSYFYSLPGKNIALAEILTMRAVENMSSIPEDKLPRLMQAYAHAVVMGLLNSCEGAHE